MPHYLAVYRDRVLAHGKSIHITFKVKNRPDRPNRRASATPSPWAKSMKRNQKGDIGSYKPDLTLSHRKCNLESSVLAQGESHLTTGFTNKAFDETNMLASASPRPWTKSVKRDQTGDVGSYKPDLTFSQRQRDPNSGMLALGELHVTTGTMKKGFTAHSTWAKSLKRDQKGDIGSYTPDLTLSQRQRNLESGILAHGESQITTGSMKMGLDESDSFASTAPSTWAKVVKRGQKGDVGSFTPDLTLSQHERNRESGVLAHGELHVTTGTMRNALDQTNSLASRSPSPWAKPVMRDRKGDVGGSTLMRASLSGSADCEIERILETCSASLPAYGRLIAV